MISDKRFILIFLLFCSLAIIPGCRFKENQKLKRLNQILQSGNEALLAKQYDGAIRIYDSGLEIAPGEPTLLTNKSVAFLRRGVDRYNTAIKLTDKKEKADKINDAKQDFTDAATFSTEAARKIKSNPYIEYIDLLSREAHKLNTFSARAESTRLFAIHVDKTKALESLEAIHEYIDVESDVEKKIKARLDAGKMLLETGNGETAIIEYKKILETNPDHSEALLGVGLALSQSGDMKKFKEAEYYLQRFVELAPDTHPMKAEIKATIEYMKKKG